MRLHEYEAKKIFLQAGISTPRGEKARSPKEAEEITRKIAQPVVVKAQVLVGGRGKAGGIRFAQSPEESGRIAEEMLGERIKEEICQELLVEKRLSIAEELYAGITVDGTTGSPLVMFSREGGVEIEGKAIENPGKIKSRVVDIFRGLQGYEARKLVKEAGLGSETAVKVAEALYRLYRIFTSYDALITEINPLVVTKEGTIVAADGILEIDDAGLYRHTEFEKFARERIPDPLAREGKEIGVSYVDLGGDIGVICSGAGLGMATIDLIGRRGRPANFLETGGGITEDQMAAAMRLVLKKSGLRGMIINLYGGINPIQEGAKGIVKVIREDGVNLPIVAKALGNFQEETWRTLEEAGVTTVKTMETEKAVEVLFQRMKK